MLSDLRHRNKTVGLKQTLKALEKGKVEAVLVAADAEERVVGRVKDLCRQNGIEIKTVDSMKKLGRSCGIKVGASVVGLLDKKVE